MKFIQLFSVLTLLLLTPALVWADKPNVIVFFIDDLGYKDLGCYGSEFYESPRLDEFAKQSVMFTQFYSSHPVCSPTRAALMTGKAPQRMGITQWIPQPSDVHLPHSETTIAECFQKAGYRTGYIGKWHLGEREDQMPKAHGFDWTRGVNQAGSPGSYFYPFTRKKKNGIGYWDIPDMEDAQKGDYLTDKLTDHAISFIEENRDGPFFLCFAHYAVHTPIQSPANLVDKYKAKREQKWGDSVVEHIKERNNSRTQVRQDGATYAAMVENLDTNVGRVLDRLKELNLEEDTIVVFTSDNGGLTTKRKSGGPTAVKPLRAGKGWCYEGGVRIPTMVRWTGKLKPRKTDVQGITSDLYPTLLEMTGQELLPQQHLDGISLLSTLKGTSNEEASDRVIGWHYPHDHGSGHSPSSAIREGDWKLIYIHASNTSELYDLSNDIEEMDNVAEDHSEVVKRLTERLHNWLQETVKRD